MMKKLLFTFLILTSLSVFSQEIIMTDGETTVTDTGTFYDSGGADGPTEAGAFIHTICPDTNGMLLVAKFQEFLVGPGDLTIYDGDSDAADVIGVFTGSLPTNDALLSITASDANPTGCLTFEFSGGVPNPAFIGWVANISDSDGKSVCIDDNGDLVITETSPPVIETGMSEVDFDFEWLLDGQLIPGETSSNITAETPGEYTVIVSNALSGIACENTSTATILESGQIDFELNILTDSFQNNEHAISVMITDIGLGEYEFRLDYGEWFDLEEGQTQIILNNLIGGEHIVTARDKFGCGLVSKKITLIDFPEFFTPNEDGYNDTWNISNFAQADAEINIYNRYGKHIYSMTPNDNWLGWAL